LIFETQAALLGCTGSCSVFYSGWMSAAVPSEVKGRTSIDLTEFIIRMRFLSGGR